MRGEPIAAINEYQVAFGLNLGNDAVARLADYYELVQKHNPLLHLVGPCTPKEFAIRHILESLTLLEYLPRGAKFADVGAGSGLPSIPCLLVRDDLSAMLIESKEKKSKFLELVVTKLGLCDRATVVNKQFEETTPGNAEHITCRALDRFTEKLPRLIRWAGGRELLLFGGENLIESLARRGFAVASIRMPLSERRFLFQAVGRSGTI